MGETNVQKFSFCIIHSSFFFSFFKVRCHTQKTVFLENPQLIFELLDQQFFGFKKFKQHNKSPSRLTDCCFTLKSHKRYYFTLRLPLFFSIHNRQSRICKNKQKNVFLSPHYTEKIASKRSTHI